LEDKAPDKKEREERNKSEQRHQKKSQDKKSLRSIPVSSA